MQVHLRDALDRLVLYQTILTLPRKDDQLMYDLQLQEDQNSGSNFLQEGESEVIASTLSPVKTIEDATLSSSIIQQIFKPYVEFVWEYFVQRTRNWQIIFSNIMFDMNMQDSTQVDQKFRGGHHSHKPSLQFQSKRQRRIWWPKARQGISLANRLNSRTSFLQQGGNDASIQPIQSSDPQLDSSSVSLDPAEQIALAYMEHFDCGHPSWTPSNQSIHLVRCVPTVQSGPGEPVKAQSNLK